MKTKPKKKRLVIGRDFDAWALRNKDGSFETDTYETRELPDWFVDTMDSEKRVVRVKFVEVKS